MYCISLETTDPFFNLAVDQYLLENTTDEFLILAINESSVIIGKHQVAHREADTRFISANNIPLLRRISGGGAVYHDRGNLNFSFIRNSQPGKQVDFSKYTLPVIEFLSSLGIRAVFEGKNDLTVGGLKISGNAEHIFRNRVLHHGTLLFDTNLEMMRHSLRNDTSRYRTRAVASNPSRVMNLADVIGNAGKNAGINVLSNVLTNVLSNVLTNVADISDFKTVMMNWFLENTPGASAAELTGEQLTAAAMLARSKYATWEWNYGYGPEYHFENSFGYQGKTSECSMYVNDGIIWECSVNGPPGLASAAKKLIGCRHMVEDIWKVLLNENIREDELDVFEFF